MVDLYTTLIINHRKTIEQVPLQLKDAVIIELTAKGYDGNGKLISNE